MKKKRTLVECGSKSLTTSLFAILLLGLERVEYNNSSKNNHMNSSSNEYERVA